MRTQVQELKQYQPLQSCRRVSFIKSITGSLSIDMTLQEEFNEFAEKAKSLPGSTNDSDKLVLYGLYKQATLGTVNTNRPGFFSPTETAKWDTWKAVEGKTKEKAMTEYITKVKDLQGAASI